MKYIIIIILSLWIIGCSNKSEEYQSDFYQSENIKKECIDPKNPYDEWSWHYAWYERGIKWNDCSWNSDSFIEWCEEYNSQILDYENCENNK